MAQCPVGWLIVDGSHNQLILSSRPGQLIKGGERIQWSLLVPKERMFCSPELGREDIWVSTKLQSCPTKANIRTWSDRRPLFWAHYHMGFWSVREMNLSKDKRPPYDWPRIVDAVLFQNRNSPWSGKAFMPQAAAICLRRLPDACLSLQGRDGN